MVVIVVVGLGYVGLPLALNLAKHFRVIGFDISAPRIGELKAGKDRNNEIAPAIFQSVAKNIEFSTDEKRIKEGDVAIICVPTPVTKEKKPDLTPLESSSTLVGRNMKKGATIVFESTTYPGCTEEFCLPILEKQSGMKLGEFHLGYSPERMNPGDKSHTIDKIYKIVSASSPKGLEIVDGVYSKITTTHKVSSIRAAEAAKVIENIQRDVNIALFNELAMLFDRMGLDSMEVFDAAATKWNFMRFRPGLVGGHCIPVDPYYLAEKAADLNFRTEMVLAGRMTNEMFPIFVARKLARLLKDSGKDLQKARVLVLGAAYKANVPDLRDSKVEELLEELRQWGIKDISMHEPLLERFDTIFGIRNAKPEGKFDAVVFAVAHAQFDALDVSSLLNGGGILIDIPRKFDRAKLKAQNPELVYWGP